VTLDIAGTIVGFAHGHQGRGKGAAPHLKVIDWWRNQAHGQQPIGDATLLVTGHFHYLALTRDGAKTHLQVPTLDGGSDWFRNTSGKETAPGIATFVVTDRGLDDLKVI
jgi:hypothetical protein